VLAALLPPAEGSWRTLLRVHPDPDERRRALTEPSRLFHMGFWDAFGTGVAVTLAGPNIVLNATLLLPSQQENMAVIGTAALFAPLAVGVVGLGVWRGTFVALARREETPAMGYLGLALGLGLTLGSILSFNTVSTEPTNWSDFFRFYVLWGAVSILSLYFFSRWMAAGASVWLEAVTSRSSLRLITVSGLTIGGICLTIWFGLLLFIFFLGSDMALNLLPIVRDSPLGAISRILASPLTFVVLVSLWVFPLAAWFWRERASRTHDWSWAFLDSSPLQLNLQRTLALRPDLALKLGLVGGLMFCAFLSGAYIGLHLGLPEAVRYTERAIFMLRWGVVTLAVLMQLGVVVLAVAWVKRLGWAHGLCAAFIAGFVMTTGLVALLELEDCVDILAFVPRNSCSASVDIDRALLLFTHIVNGGALLSLLVVVGVSILVSQLRSPRLHGSRQW
jgi:hypothetical protein